MAVTEADVSAFMGHGGVVRSDIRWRQVGRTNWRAEAPVEDTYEGAAVKLTATFNTRLRNLSYSLIWAGQRIRGLDIGGPPHPNPDGTRLNTPHKHRWTDRYRDEEAYCPSDITATDLSGILTQFLAECNLRMEGSFHPIMEQGEMFQ